MEAKRRATTWCSDGATDTTGTATGRGQKGRRPATGTTATCTSQSTAALPAKVATLMARPLPDSAGLDGDEDKERPGHADLAEAVIELSQRVHRRLQGAAEGA